MMKILHIHPALKGGGIESMICSLANEMSKTEDVTICSIFAPQNEDVFWQKISPNVKKIHLGKTKEGFSVKEIFYIYKTIKSGGYDIVHIHGFFYYYFLSVLLLCKNVVFFYTIHSDAKMENVAWDRKFFPLKKYCFQRGLVHPITISNVSKESFNGLYHCESNLIYNGVPKPVIACNVDLIKDYRISCRTKVFIHAGRIDTPKNQIVLCRVFNRLIKNGYDILLLIAGSIQREDIFKSMEPFFNDRIKYLGERNDIPQLMSQCLGMCLPSIWEGLPVTLLEALSVGCIPICSPVGGIPDVVKDGENGYLSVSCGEEDYYSTMKRFLSLSEDELSLLQQRCKKSFETFDIEKTSKSYLELYRSKVGL